MGLVEGKFQDFGNEGLFILCTVRHKMLEETFIKNQ